MKITVFVILCLAVVSCTASDDDDDGFEQSAENFLIAAEDEIKKHNLTCENHDESYCSQSPFNISIGFTESCRALFGAYLCDHVRTAADMKPIVKALNEKLISLAQSE